MAVCVASVERAPILCHAIYERSHKKITFNSPYTIRRDNAGACTNGKITNICALKCTQFYRVPFCGEETRTKTHFKTQLKRTPCVARLEVTIAAVRRYIPHMFRVVRALDLSVSTDKATPEDATHEDGGTAGRKIVPRSFGEEGFNSSNYDTCKQANMEKKTTRNK